MQSKSVDQIPLKKYLFVGLGNPGPRYEMTRHNLGFLVLKAFANQHSWKFKHELRFQADIAKGKIQDQEVHLLLPLTYMNESGVAVKKYMKEKKFSIDQIVVVVDDVAIPFEEIRLRTSGSSGGHNGLKSIEAHLQDREYARLRMGIGCQKLEIPLENYVLQRFSEQERGVLESFIKRATAILENLLSEDIAKVMNDVNTKKSDLIKRLGE